MAGEQDILALGLNIDSFDARKAAVLKEYVTLFDTLSKYDGKIFNPVMGDGLTKFNKSLAETNRLTDEINAKLSRLNSSRINSQIFPSKEVKSFASETDNAAKSISVLKVNAGGAVVPLEGIGKNLTHMLTNLRYIAYILPGIGIAGIFNLAFEAIEGAAKELGIFNDAQLDLIRSNIQVNENLTDQIKSYQDLSRVIKAFIEDYRNYTNVVVGGKGLPGSEETVTRLKEDNEARKQRGIEQGIILKNEVDIATKAYDRLAYIIKGLDPYKGTSTEENVERLKVRSEELLSNIQLTQARIKSIEQDRVTLEGKTLTKKQAEETKKQYESEINLSKAQYDELTGVLKDYYENKDDLNKKNQELAKFNSDQERKLLVERAKDDIELDLSKQKAILDNDKKFHDEKQKAILKEYQDNVNLANINRINVTGTKQNPNLSATPVEIAIAQNKESDDVLKAKIKRDKDLEKNDTEFYQRRLLALKEVSKDEIEQDAIKNERIYQNEENTLAQRLEAYEQYIIDKQAIRDREYELAIRKGASSDEGATSLTPEEQQRIEKHRETEKANIVANSQKQIYDIVYSSLRKIIKATEDEIAQEEDLSKEGYTKALHDLNEKYEGKKISLEKYHREKQKIDNKYYKLELDEQIKQDEQNLLLLKETSLKKIDVELEYRRKLLEIAKAGGNETEINKAQGGVDAAEQAQKEINKDIKTAKDKLESDRLKREQIEPLDNKKRGKWIDAAVEIEEKINESIRRIYDERIQMQIDLAEQRKDILDQQYEDESDAIDKSSLKAKDKQALDIQIQAEKEALDKDAAIKEKELKIDEFNFNKKLQLANAAIGIAAAIIKDGLTTPKSIADAVIGAAEIAEILATEPPSFEKGVKNFKGGLARYAEKGPEEIRIPGKKPFIALTETISYLPKGADVIPLRKDYPVFGTQRKDESWEQTRFLAKQIKSSKQEIKNVFKPTIVIDMGFENRKRQILGN